MFKKYKKFFFFFWGIFLIGMVTVVIFFWLITAGEIGFYANFRRIRKSHEQICV